MEAVVPMTSGVFPDADPGLQDPVEYMHETPPDRAGDKTTAMEDSIASFADTQNKADGVPDIEPVQSAVDQGASSHTADKENHMDANEPVEKTCPCAAEQEDEIMVECEGCATWFHMPCAGYLEEEDLPDKYYCIICKMKTAGHFSKAKMDEAQSYLPSLTLERRALKKIYKKKKFENTNNMMREIGCDANDFRNLLERLLGSGLLKTEVTQVIRKVNQNASRKFNVTTYHAQVGAQDRKRYGDYFKPGGAIELKAVGITASTQESKRMASPSAKAEGGKENVARQTRETRSTMHKTLPFAKGPVRAEKGRPIAKESRPEAGKNTPPRTELARPTIPLPKSKPREKPANHLTGETRAGGKGLFRTAASVLVQPLAEGEDREQSEADVISKAAEECDGQPRPNKASAPEEDVDMGV
ncbi:hypothetical protein QFC19_008052 [Naganishia cerealis]|uniref:Uncharacterized protein n=1 Tax=Naganishia cerealis TaxID=610337 RepID=A0ACC2V5L3_9TREE|nr:hypothetical protein QFC19_008052 [Naganishia cerealis]